MLYRYTLDSALQGTLVDAADPINWQDAEFVLSRDSTYHGIFFEYTLPLKLVKDAYAYVLTAYENDKLHADVTIKVEVSCISCIPSYTTVFTGKLNFSKIKIINSNICYIEIQADPQSPVVNLKNNGDIKYPFSYNDTTLIKAKQIDGITRFADTSTQPIQAVTFDTFYGGGFGAPIDSRVKILWQYFNVFQNDFAANNDFQPPEIVDSASDPSPLINILYPSAYSVNINEVSKVIISRTTGSVNAICNGLPDVFEVADLQVFLELKGSINTVISMGTYTAPSVCRGSDVTYEFDVNTSYSNGFNLIAGDQIYVYYYVHIGGTSGYVGSPQNITDIYNIQQLAGNLLRVEAIVTLSPPSTQHHVSTLYNAWQTIVSDAAAGMLTDNAHFFSACGSFLRLCNGYSLRGLLSVPSRVSFNDLFKSLAAIYNIGISIEEAAGVFTMIVDKWFTFYTLGTAFTYDTAFKIETTIDDKDIFNEVKVGYQTSGVFAQFSTKDLFGQRTYSTRTPLIKNSKEALSPFIASDILIDSQRQGIAQSVGLPNDENMFILVLKEGVTPNEVYQTDVGAGEPLGIINYPLTPARNALRQLQLVTTAQNILTLFYVSSDKDVSLQCGEQMSGPCRIENTSICEDNHLLNTYIDDTQYGDTPIFTGNIITSEVPMTISQYWALRANKYDLIKVRRNTSEAYKSGWLRQVKFKPEKEQATLILIETQLV